MCRTSCAPAIDASKETSCSSHFKVDSSTIANVGPISTAFDSFIRICWAPVGKAHRQFIVRYDVQLVGWGGKRCTFHTTVEEPSILLPTDVVREKVGETFTAQIRVLNRQGEGEWSDVSRVLSVTKPSPPTSPQSTLEAVSVAALSKAKGSAKRPGSILDSFISKFRRPITMASLA